MAFLQRIDIKNVVARALDEVADFDHNSDFEGFLFQHFHSFQMQVFLSSMRTLLNKEPYRRRDGTISDEAFYDITLSQAIIDKWKFIGDCINYVTDHHTVNKAPAHQRLNLA